jgi:nucleotide-binding universal stress UspA family protein
LALQLVTISLALQTDSESDPQAAIRYALGLAGRAKAHLCATVAAPFVAVPALAYSGYAVATQMLMIVEKENDARREEAGKRAAAIRTEAAKIGVSAEVEVLSAVYDPPTSHFQQMARMSDVCVTSAPAGSPMQREVVVDLLFGAGAPVLLVPTGWENRDRAIRAVVAWDGGRAAARAVRDALPLLAEAETVEIVSVLGDKDVAENAAAGLARHLARHCKAVSARVLPMVEGDVAATLSKHVRLRDADLLIMGAYGHSRLREFLLGGATRDTLAKVETPTLMSH